MNLHLNIIFFLSSSKISIGFSKECLQLIVGW